MAARVGPDDELAESDPSLHLAAIGWAPLLDGLPVSAQRFLARAAALVEVPAGADAYRAAGADAGLLLIQSGTLQVVAAGHGHRLPVAMLGPGDLALTPAIAGEPGRRLAIAAGAASLVSLPQPALAEVLAEQPETAARLARVGERRRSLERAVIANQGRLAPSRDGRVVAVHSTRGGAGTTMAALALAHCLAEARPYQVVVVDLALPFGQCAYFMGCDPTTSIARAAQAGDQHRDDVLVSGACMGASGLALLPAVLHPEEADLLSAEVVAQAIHVLRREFAHVVVDAGARLAPLVLAALERSDEVLNLVTPDLPALRDAVTLREGLGWRGQRMRHFVNHACSRPALDACTIQSALGTGRLPVIRHDPDLARTTARGDVSRLRSSSLGRAMLKVAREAVPGAAQEVERAAEGRRRRSRWLVG